jgi:mono/diheme cytochrome c family protein
MEIYRERGRASLLVLGPAVLLGAGLIAYLIVTRDTGQADPGDQAQVARGMEIYARHCAACHGEELEGQPDWRIRMANGRLPAPPHDGSGHTWHHPDAALFGITRQGLIPPYAPEGYQSDMPGFAGTLTDADIWAVLAFIKSRWPEEMQKFQQDINARAQDDAR